MPGSFQRLRRGRCGAQRHRHPAPEATERRNGANENKKPFVFTTERELICQCGTEPRTCQLSCVQCALGDWWSVGYASACDRHCEPKLAGVVGIYGCLRCRRSIPCACVRRCDHATAREACIVPRLSVAFGVPVRKRGCAFIGFNATCISLLRVSMWPVGVLRLCE